MRTTGIRQDYAMDEECVKVEKLGDKLAEIDSLIDASDETSEAVSDL